MSIKSDYFLYFSGNYSDNKIMNLNPYFLKLATPLKNTPMGTVHPEPGNLAHGLCFYYAYVFAQIYGGTCLSVTLKKNNDGKELMGENHMIVHFNGLYYDGDHPLGTTKIPQYDPNRHLIIKHKNPLKAILFWGQEDYLSQFDKIVKKINTKIALEHQEQVKVAS